MAVLQKKICVFFPVKGSRGRKVQSIYTLGEFWVPEIHERGHESRSLATMGARVKRAPRKHAGVRLDRAHKHERALPGLASGRVERV